MSTTGEERTELCLRQARKGLDYVYDKRGKDWTMSTTSEERTGLCLRQAEHICGHIKLSSLSAKQNHPFTHYLYAM